MKKRKCNYAEDTMLEIMSDRLGVSKERVKRTAIRKLYKMYVETPHILFEHFACPIPVVIEGGHTPPRL
jgi:hypothetical protein